MEEKGFFLFSLLFGILMVFCFYLHVIVHFVGSKYRTQGRPNCMKQGLKEKTYRNAAYWLAPDGFLSLSSYCTHDRQIRAGVVHCELVLYYQSPIQKVLSQACSKKQSYGCFSSTEVASSQMTLSFLNVT